MMGLVAAAALGMGVTIQVHAWLWSWFTEYCRSDRVGTATRWAERAEIEESRAAEFCRAAWEASLEDDTYLACLFKTASETCQRRAERFRSWSLWWRGAARLAPYLPNEELSRRFPNARKQSGRARSAEYRIEAQFLEMAAALRDREKPSPENARPSPDPP